MALAPETARSRTRSTHIIEIAVSACRRIGRAIGAGACFLAARSRESRHKGQMLQDDGRHRVDAEIEKVRREWTMMTGR